MSTIDIKKHFSDVFDNFSDYVLIKNEEGNGYSIFDVANQSYFHARDYYVELIDLLLKENIKVVDTLEEVRNRNHVHYVQVWNEEEKKYILVPEKETTTNMKKKQSNKNE
jgi:hypothetical protein